jgi:Zn ribbon nucleic-acid-binding protein
MIPLKNFEKNMKNKECICCDSANTHISFNESFFDVPVMKCLDCGYNFTMIEDKEQIKKLYSKSF